MIMKGFWFTVLHFIISLKVFIGSNSFAFGESQDPAVGCNMNELKCYKKIGLGDYDPDKYQLNSQFKGIIHKTRIRHIDLTKFDDIDKFCSAQPMPGKFQPCTGEFSGVKVLMAADRSDLTPWMAPSSIDFESQLSYPALSHPFASHLIAIKDAFVNSWGTIFNYEHWYDHGGCTDRATYMKPSFIYEMTKHTILSFNQPVISIVHPFSSMYFHEFIEIHAMLLMTQPLIKSFPNITIFINRHFHHSQLFPLLTVLGFDKMNDSKTFLRGYNFTTIGSYHGRHYVSYAPWVITPVSHWCEYISRSVTRQMRDGYAKLPYWNDVDVGAGIVVHDRVSVKPKRFLREGQMIFESLKEKYGHTHSVRMFFGNETLEEIVKIFRGAKVLIASHGAGLTNMLFMPEGGMVVEFRPQQYPNRCFVDLANNIGIKHYMYEVTTNLKGYEMRVDGTAFLNKLYPLLIPFVGSPVPRAGTDGEE